MTAIERVKVTVDGDPYVIEIKVLGKSRRISRILGPGNKPVWVAPPRIKKASMYPWGIIKPVAEEMQQKGMTVFGIAKQLGIPHATLWRWVDKPIEELQKVTEGGFSGVHLCITCKRAYGDDCFGVPREQRGWVVKREDGGSVVKCKKYEKGRKPLVVRPKWCRLYAKIFGEEGMHEGY